MKKVFYHNDHLGGVNVISDVNGARVQLTEYDPWGKVSRSEGNVDPEHRFTGQKLDPENGLYYYGARYYDPELARFISPDPIVPSAGDPQSHNRYSYVRNNPVKYTDPTGNSFLSFLFGGIFKIFGFVTKYVIPAFRIAAGVVELMSPGGFLSGLQSITSGMSSYIKNSQFQFASQVFGFFASAGSPGGGATVGDSVMSESTSVAGGSGGDSGSGEINLGPGSFTYWAKNSAGEYEIHPYPSDRYYGETTFTFVRTVGDAPTGPGSSGNVFFVGIGGAAFISLKPVGTTRGIGGQAGFGLAYNTATREFRSFGNVGSADPNNISDKVTGFSLGAGPFAGQQRGGWNDFFGISRENTAYYGIGSVTEITSNTGASGISIAGGGKGFGLGATSISSETFPLFAGE